MLGADQRNYCLGGIMSQEERYGTRGLEYSAWHRRLSTKRFVGIENAQLLAMIDLDIALYVEYEESSKMPVGLIEVAQDVGQPYKTATVTKNLAIMAGIPAYVVLYEISETKNPAYNECNDISNFRIKRLHPSFDKEWRNFTPEEYAKSLLKLRKYTCDRFDKQGK